MGFERTYRDEAWECSVCGRILILTTAWTPVHHRHLSRYEARFPMGDERQWCTGPAVAQPSRRKDVAWAAYLLGGLQAVQPFNEVTDDEATDCPPRCD